MSFDELTPLERSVLRAIREARAWTRDDLLRETPANEQHQLRDSGDMRKRRFRQETHTDDISLSIDGDFLSRALLEGGPDATPNAPDMETKKRGELEGELLDPKRGEKKGFELTGFTIEGGLDISGGEVGFPVTFYGCVFEGPINLDEARCQNWFFLLGVYQGMAGHLCQAMAFSANLARFDGVLVLNGLEGWTAVDEKKGQSSSRRPIKISLHRVLVTGALSLDGVKLIGGLDANGAQIGENIFLRNGFKAGGEVNLVGASIGGQLACRGGEFSNPGGVALDCGAITVKRDVSLRNGFEANGEVNLVGAKIDGWLNCSGGKFSNPGGVALNCAAITVKQTVLLRVGFKADGAVIFTRAKITGNFMCDGAEFEGGRTEEEKAKKAKPRPTALNLVAATIEADLVLSHIKQLAGDVDLRQARARVLIDDYKHWKKAGKNACRFRLDGFRYDRIGDDHYTGDARAITNAGKRLKWLQSQPRDDLEGEGFKPQPFTYLAEVLMVAGHELDAKRILYNRDKVIAKNEVSIFKPLTFFRPDPLRLLTNILTWVSNIIVFWTAGFGHRPQRAGVLALIILGCGTFIFNAANKAELMRPAQEEVIIALADKDGGLSIDDVQPIKVSAFFYAADVFFPIVDLSQQKYWIPKDRYEIDAAFDAYAVWPELTQAAPWKRWLGERFGELMNKGLAKWYYWISIFAGWLLTTVLVAAFSGVLAKDR